MTIPTGPIVVAVALIAEATVSQVPEPWWQSIIQTGAIGGVLLYFMFWGRQLLRDNTRAVNLQAATIQALILHCKHQDAAISELTAEIQKQTDDEIRDANKAAPTDRR